MADTMVGSAIISVADIVFFKQGTTIEIGKAIALTDAGIDSTMNNQEIRGGYLNPLLFNIMTSRQFNLSMTSATFKMIYLAMQAGKEIQSKNMRSYIFKECNTATNGVVTLQNPPAGYIHVVLPDGKSKDIDGASSTTINVGSEINGTVECSYFTTKFGETISIDTSSQPMVVSAYMRIHGKEQDGTRIEHGVDIPLLQFTGEINFSLTADGVSTQSLNAVALAFAEDCGEPRYCNWTQFKEGVTNVVPSAIVAIPNAYTMTAEQKVTPNVIAVMPEGYSNVRLAPSKQLSFESSGKSFATVDSATGEITAVAPGASDVTVTFTPEGGETPLTSVIKVTVSE